MRHLITALFAILTLAWSGLALAQSDAPVDYKLSAGDSIRILVFQNPDLTLETRITESGTVSYPLIGAVKLGNLSLRAAEKEIADRLREGGFVQQPQVTIVLLQNFGNQVAVLGQVNRPGRYPLDNTTTRLTEMLAVAGGIAQTGSDIAIVTGKRNGQPYTQEIDIPALFLSHEAAQDIVLVGGDSIYVHRAPVFYIYGEVQRPGAYRVERKMTLRQALAQGGGPTPRGTEKDPRVNRRKTDGSVAPVELAPNDLVQPDDVIYVRESLF